MKGKGDNSYIVNDSLNLYNVETEGILQRMYQVPKEALTLISFYPLKYFNL